MTYTPIELLEISIEDWFYLKNNGIYSVEDILEYLDTDKYLLNYIVPEYIISQIKERGLYQVDIKSEL